MKKSASLVVVGSLVGSLALAVTAATAAAAPADPTVAVDWPRFLAQHDLLWEAAADEVEEGAFLGNGLVSAMAYADREQALSFQLGRSDVTDHKKGKEPMLARPRLPIGRLNLKTAGKLQAADGRLSLWDAEWSATLRTENGQVSVRAYVHADQPVLVIEVDGQGGERGARFGFEPALAINERLLARQFPIVEDDLNPAPFVEEHGAVRVSVQRRKAGGEYAVAWQEKAMGGKRLLVLSIADSVPGPEARAQAVAAVARAIKDGPASLRRSHQAYWHRFYPASFVSIPNARLESFYWIQMYKLASATRADRPAIDTLGPWYQRTPWPGMWWNLNIQLTYWPLYAANRLSLAESMLNIIDRNQENLRNNVTPKLRGPEVMAVGRMGGPDAVSPIEYVGPRGPQNGAHEITNLVWVMHNYWLHWRHSMEPALRARLVPLLKASVAYVMLRLAPGPDGKLHLPEAVSPEFPKTAPDTNYDLSLLRWGLQTLLELAPQDPTAGKWKDTLARLTPYPVGPTGYLIGRGQPLDQSHRHFSHLLMVYPLRLVTGADAAERQLIERSLAHWIGFEGALQGYSFVGASAISSLLGKGNDAEKFLDDLLRRFVKPNTMYLEAGPVIETPLGAAQAVHEMLLQSWGGILRVFPALPDGWKDVAFHDLRTEGAFLVSAVRRGGRTVMVRVHSLAGEPATLRVEMDNPQVVGSAAGATAQKQPDGRWKLTLARGQSVILQAAGTSAAERTVTPVAGMAGASGERNAFGVR